MVNYILIRERASFRKKCIFDSKFTKGMTMKKTLLLILCSLLVVTGCVQSSAVAKESDQKAKAELIANSPYKRPSDEEIKALLSVLPLI